MESTVSYPIRRSPRGRYYMTVADRVMYPFTGPQRGRKQALPARIMGYPIIAHTADVAAFLHGQWEDVRPTPETCQHPPERVWFWYAYNPETGKVDFPCAACCDCGAALLGGATLDDDEAGAM